MHPSQATRFVRFLAVFMIVLVVILYGCGGSSGGGKSALSITSTVPADGAVDVSPETAIEVHFNGEIEPGTATSSTIILDTGSASIPGEVDCSGTKVVFIPSYSLSQSATYTARITTGVKDTRGSPLASDYAWSFTTEGLISPSDADQWAAVATGEAHTVAIREDGTLWAWGCNSSGQLGDGEGGDETHDYDRSSPIQVGQGADWDIVSAGRLSTLAIRRNGTLWAWGLGKLGDGESTRRRAPVQIGSRDGWMSASPGQLYSFTVALREDGTLWGWGDNMSSLLGDPAIIEQSLVPIPIGDDDDWEMLDAGKDHVTAVKADGTLWAWGCNIHGQIGDGLGGDPADDHQVSAPAQVGSDDDWYFVSNGNQYSLAIREDGSLWAWGHNNFGQLGDGTQISRNIPVRAGNATGWKTASAGWDHSAGVKEDGTLWTWGANSYGQLGDGTTTGRFSPEQVGTGKRWVDAASGKYYTVALQDDGTLWAWGINEHGQLGDGTREQRLMPVNVH